MKSGIAADNTQRNLGAVLVVISYGLSGLAAYAILANRPDSTTREGRHLIAGALAIVSLAFVEILIAAVPLRRGEKWAFWAILIPLLLLVIPMMLIDAANVAPDHLVITLTPFCAGILLAGVGLFLAR